LQVIKVTVPAAAAAADPLAAPMSIPSWPGRLEVRKPDPMGPQAGRVQPRGLIAPVQSPPLGGGGWLGMGPPAATVVLAAQKQEQNHAGDGDADSDGGVGHGVSRGRVVRWPAC